MAVQAGVTGMPGGVEGRVCVLNFNVIMPLWSVGRIDPKDHWNELMFNINTFEKSESITESDCLVVPNTRLLIFL